MNKLYQEDLSIDELIEKTLSFTKEHIDYFSENALQAIGTLPLLKNQKEKVQNNIKRFAKKIEKNTPNYVITPTLIGVLCAMVVITKIDITKFSLEKQFILADCMSDDSIDCYREKGIIIAHDSLLSVILRKSIDPLRQYYLLDKVYQNSKQQMIDVENPSKVSSFLQEQIQHIETNTIDDLLAETHFEDDKAMLLDVLKDIKL